MKLFSKKGKWGLALFAIFCLVGGVVARAVYLYQFSDSPLCSIPLGPDVEEYFAWAKRIMSGELLWAGVHIHSPLYPYFLAALTYLFAGTTECVVNIRAVQLFLGLISGIPLAAAIAIAVRGGESGDGSDDGEEGAGEDRGWNATLPVFLVLWAWYPPLIYYTGELTSEVILVPLLGVAVYFLYRWEDNVGGRRSVFNLGLAGLASGLAVVTHPIAGFFLLLETVYLGIAGAKRLRNRETEVEDADEERDDAESAPRKKPDTALALLTSLAVFILMASIPILFVASRNVLVLDGPPLQANSGFNIYLGNGPEADGTCRLRPGPKWDAFHAKAKAEAAKIGLSKDQYLLEETIEWIASNPLRWLLLVGRKALYFWSHDEIAAGADIHPLFYFTPFQRAFPWAFGLCAVLALMALFYHIGDVEFIRRHRHFIILIMAFFIAQTLLVVSGRYRVGAIPAILVLAAAGIDTILHAIVHLERRYVGLLPAAALAAVVVLLPKPPFDDRREWGEACTLMGEALLRKGQPEKAEECLQAAIAVQPKWSRNYNLLGVAMERRGNNVGAKLAYLKAVELDPGDPEGYVNLATVCEKEGDKKHTVNLYRKALSLNRPSASLHYNYALFLEGSGDTVGAEKHYGKALMLDPVDPKILNNLAVLKLQHGKPDEAVSLLEKAVRLDPNNQGRLLNLTVALLMSGREEEAKSVAGRLAESHRHAVGLAPSKSEARNPKLETRNPNSDTDSVNPQSEIKNPKSETLNPESEIRNPKPQAQNPKPEARNPKSESDSAPSGE